MSSPEHDDDANVPSPLLAVLRDPAQGQHRLPYLLSLVDEDDVSIRLRASLALCLVVEESPGMLEYVVRRLIDRLDDDSPTEVVHTLDYLAAEYPREVDEVLVELEEEAEVQARRRMYRSGGGYARSDYVQRTEPRPDAGGPRLPTSAAGEDPRKAFTEDEEEDEAGSQSRSGSTDDDGTDEDEDDADEDDSTNESDRPRFRERGEESDDGTQRDLANAGSARGRASALDERLAEIVSRSKFDSLDVLATREQERYADVYRTLGTIGGEEQAIALNVYHFPDEETAEFTERFRNQLPKWADGDDHTNVLTVYDWGHRPRPWSAVQYASVELADREDVSLKRALVNAVRLAQALSHLHQRGIVHGGIDPGNVVYAGGALDEAAGNHPLLTNVGLLEAYRWHSNPTKVLDPRYAAPEYFDRRFGKVDHLTDIYQVGMVLYRLLTGRAPFPGNVDSLREKILEETPRPPSQVNADVPPALDQIVAKATAKRKMARYESVAHLQQELLGLQTGSTLDGS